MPPSIALLLWFLLLLALLRFDPARVAGMSLALWVPVIEFFLIGSRLPSQWLGLVQAGTTAQVLQEGNFLDRSVYVAMILLSIGVLAFRSFKWSRFFGKNIALVALMTFALLSVVWSDYPYVAFKRWFRDLAYYLTILIVLSDTSPLEAVRTVFRRACFLLIPLSIVIIKYFPEMGRQYDVWTGAPMYVGIATSKNMLGVMCLFSGLFFVWDTFARWADRKEQGTRRIILLNLSFVAMSVWLLSFASSATASICLVLGCLVLATANVQPIRRRPALLLTGIPVGFAFLVLSSALGLDINSLIANAVGRDPTLTGRTLIWETLLSLNTNPLIGTGYETFWMGPRLQQVWQQRGTINTAHNGYLEIYLNLGLVGLCLLCGFLVASYRRIWERFNAGHSLAHLGVTLWTVLVVYNLTEAAFPSGLLWLAVLPAALAVPHPNDAVVKATVTPQRIQRTRPLGLRPSVRPVVGQISPRKPVRPNAQGGLVRRPVE